MGWFVALGVDVNRDYLAFGWLTNDADYVASVLGGWGMHPLTSWLFEEHVEFEGPLALGHGVTVPAVKYVGVLMWLPGRKNRRQKRWRRLALGKLFAQLTPWLRFLADAGTPAVVGLEDLRGMAEKRGIHEIEYAKIWKKAMGSFGALLREGDGYRAYVGRGRSVVIALDPRGTSSICAICAAEGKTTPVKERPDRTVYCPIHGAMNRDINAAFNIAIRAVRIYAGDPPGGARGGLENPQPRVLPAGLPRDDRGVQDAHGDETVEIRQAPRLDYRRNPHLRAPPGALYAYLEEVFKCFGCAEGFGVAPSLIAAFSSPSGTAHTPVFSPHVGA
ncbi:zinc ribbon domain-containing protein [Pyrobaculum aerophilum]|mgnify:CR=1 FL=1|uniref:zinc ribbon domain-containing protein n=1 Tax=Pyrobaculum aerophilum TaxID=13773 RepID=UPI002FDB2FDA